MRIGLAYRDERTNLCAIVDDRVIDLSPLAADSDRKHFESLESFLQGGEEARQLAQGLLDGAGVNHADATPLAATRLEAPHVRGAKIICHAVNYPSHAAHVGVGERPFFFYKPATSVISNGDPIESHVEISKELDFETELAIVIGRTARDVQADDAYSVIAGYTIVNDVSHREFQFNTHAPELRKRYGMNWTQGKGLDGSCVIGPWITLADELPEPYPLRLRCWVDGDLRQDASTGTMIFQVPQLIAEITRGMTLRPGDIIATGTPGGTILDSGGPWLQPGNRVRCEIEGLGAIENPVAGS